MRDEGYAKFCAKLTPNIPAERFIGVRTPILRKYASQLYKSGDYEDFLAALPHYYYEENNLHAFLIERITPYERCIAAVRAFLPYIDNWACCDVMTPKVFKTHTGELIGEIEIWLASDLTYTVRYAIRMLMAFYLGDEYKPEYARHVAALRSEEYYVNMMRAWYFATALAVRPADIIQYFEDASLDEWTRRKAIQKSIESFRIDGETKAYLKSLK